MPLIVDGATIIDNGILAQSKDANAVVCQSIPWRLRGSTQVNHRRSSVLLTRLLAGMRAAIDTPLVERFHVAVDASRPSKRWTDGFYLDQPDEWDDPYRFFRW